MKVEILEPNDISQPSEKFIIEAIDNYILTSKYPKQLQMKKMDLVIENNNRIIEQLKNKLNSFIKIVNERKDKITNLNTKNHRDLARLKMEINSGVD